MIDQLDTLPGRAAPALNATSDQPVVDAAPVTESAPAADTADEADTPALEYKAPPALPPLPSVQLLDVGKQPLRRDFDHPDDYDAALIEHGTRRAFRAEQEQRVQHAATARVQASWAAATEAATKVVPDFADVAMSNDVTITEPMALTILHTENGPAVAYHLGKNPKEAARIAQLPEPMQVYEIGRIAAQAKLTRPQNAEQRPAQRREETMDAYAARRLKELAARRPGAR